MPDDSDVVVTGLGAVTPLGRDVASLWEALVAGRSGAGPITSFDASGYSCTVAGEVRDYTPHAIVPPERVASMHRSALFAVDAALQAVDDARLPILPENAAYAGIVLGSAWPPEPRNHAVAETAAALGIRGPSLLVTAGGASASSAIAVAAGMVRRGDVQVALAGGTEAPITPELLGRMCDNERLTKAGVARPFDAAADGFVMSEGAGVLVLESGALARQRGARVYGSVAGAALITEPDTPMPGAREAGRALQQALRQPALLQGEIDYYCAFAPGTPALDRAETEAVKHIFGELTASKLTISAPKSMLGHLLGASGALDAVVCLKTMETGTVPPTIHLSRPAEGCDLDYTSGEARSAAVRNAMCYAYGFGGHHVALCFSGP